MVFYHGTSTRLWRASGAETGYRLYLTDDRDEAAKYAEEAVQNKRDRPIVVEFQMIDVRLLPVKFEPDWGWVDALENDLKHHGKKLERLPTWEESLSAVGSFCVSGFTDKLKSYGKVTPTLRGLL